MIDELRKRMDEASRELVASFEARMAVVDEIAQYKRTNGIPIDDTEREKSLLNKLLPKDADAPYQSYARKLMLSAILLSKEYQHKCMNLYLIGMPGCGKSETAKKLAEQTGREAVDTDVIVCDRAQTDIRGIFELEGEQGFREREHEALLIVAEHGGVIVATGGGILTYGDNIKILKSSGYCVFLDRPLDSLIKTPITGRPLIDNTDDITRIYYERIVDYKTTADAIINPESPDAVSRTISFMKEKNMF